MWAFFEGLGELFEFVDGAEQARGEEVEERPDLTRAVLDSKCVAIAYETVQLPNRELPLLTPMSEVAGRMAIAVRRRSWV